MKTTYPLMAVLLALAAPGSILALVNEVIVTTTVPVYVYVSNGVDVPYTPPATSTLVPTPAPTPTPAPAASPALAPAAPIAAGGDGAPVEKNVVPAETTVKVAAASGPPGTPTHTPTSAPIEGNTLAAATVPAAAITAAPPPVNGNGVLTISIVNKWTAPLSISYGNNPGSPDALGPPQAGSLGTATTVVYPTGWAGRIYLGKTTNAAGSKIEGSTTGANDIDISYVDGYSVPVTCSVQGTGVSGCNIDLWSVSGDCPSMTGDHELCPNPMQGVADGPAVPWFLPCQGAAYTFPNDNVANNGDLRSADVTCCIGTAAQGCTEAPVRQGKEKNVASRKRTLAEALEERQPNGASLLPNKHSHLRRHAHKARSHGHQMVHDLKDLI